jgi:hypothetical protein
LRAQQGQLVTADPTGKVHPLNETLYTVANAKIYMYIVGTTGVNTAPSSQIECGSGSNVGGPDASGNCYVNTDASGNFTITNDYECPNDTSDTSPVYLIAKDGTPSGVSSPNTQFTFMVVSPYTCGYLQATPSVYLDLSDFTTAIAAFEAAPFANSNASLGGDGFGTSLANTLDYNAIMAAFQAANTVVPVSTAVYGGSDSNVQKQLNTLAEFTEVCNRSAGTGSPCSNLYSAATQGAFTSTNAPADPWQSIASIAQYPNNSSNTTAQLDLIPATPYYSPVDLAVPSGGWAVQVSGSPSITCPATPQHKLTSLVIHGTNLSGSSNAVVVAYGQVGTVTANTSTSVTFTIPSHLGTGAIAVYQNGLSSNACPFQIEN